jgi:hypothetical protein
MELAQAMGTAQLVATIHTTLQAAQQSPKTTGRAESLQGYDKGSGA